MNKALLCAAFAGIMTAGVVAQAQAAEHAMTDSKVHCFGIAKAGHNACKSVTGAHSCAGQAKVDNDPNEFVVAASAEACTSEGGKLEAPHK